jgi:hypothetical protein
MFIADDVRRYIIIWPMFPVKQVFYTVVHPVYIYFTFEIPDCVISMYSEIFDCINTNILLYFY